MHCYFFFFQAEDGIRDDLVTGVQTCALPIFAVYAVLDGFDLGIGAIHLLLGRTREERTRLIDSIGPVWNGNEARLIAAGGSMIVAFPNPYAARFTGFYLALMLVLCLLLPRVVGVE